MSANKTGALNMLAVASSDGSFSELGLIVDGSPEDNIGQLKQLLVEGRKTILQYTLNHSVSAWLERSTHYLRKIWWPILMLVHMSEGKCGKNIDTWDPKESSPTSLRPMTPIQEWRCKVTFPQVGQGSEFKRLHKITITACPCGWLV